MKKQIISAFLAAAITLTSVALPVSDSVGGVLESNIEASAATTYTSGNYEYTVSNGKATITAYTGSAKSLTIPSTLGGYTVASIGNDAFFECTSLTSITIPDKHWRCRIFLLQLTHSKMLQRVLRTKVLQK